MLTREDERGEPCQLDDLIRLARRSYVSWAKRCRCQGDLKKKKKCILEVSCSAKLYTAFAPPAWGEYEVILKAATLPESTKVVGYFSQIHRLGYLARWLCRYRGVHYSFSSENATHAIRRVGGPGAKSSSSIDGNPHMIYTNLPTRSFGFWYTV